MDKIILDEKISKQLESGYKVAELGKVIGDRISTPKELIYINISNLKP